MKRPTIKMLTEQLDRLSKSEKEERDRRYQLDQENSRLEKQVENLQCQVNAQSQEVQHWQAQVARAQGHITGMRETLLASGLVKNVDIKEINYEHQLPPAPQHPLGRKLWPEF